MSSRAAKSKHRAKNGPEIGQPLHTPPVERERFGVARMLVRQPAPAKTEAPCETAM